MRLAKLLVFAAFALLVFGAVGTTVASAEEKDGPPEILCLVKECVKGLEGEFLSHEGEISKLVSLSGGTIEATDAHIKIKNCEALPKTEEKDTNLCKDQTIDFTGVKASGIGCNTENDAAETVLVLLDLHLAAEEFEKKLEPLLLAKILTPELKEGAIILKCGIIKIEVKGTVACLLLPGLVNIPTSQMVEVLCKVNAMTHDAETGKCELLCEWLEKDPFESKLGAKFEDAWENIHLLGFFNKDVFIDD